MTDSVFLFIVFVLPIILTVIATSMAYTVYILGELYLKLRGE